MITSSGLEFSIELRMSGAPDFMVNGTARGQWRAMRHGIAGIPGNGGIVESVTYRI